VEGATVFLTQWYYDPDAENPADGNSHWFQNEAFADGTADANAGAPTGARATRTDSDGAYLFEELPTFIAVSAGDDFRLASYRASVVLDEGSYATRMHMGGDAT